MCLCEIVHNRRRIKIKYLRQFSCSWNRTTCKLRSVQSHVHTSNLKSTWILAMLFIYIHHTSSQGHEYCIGLQWSNMAYFHGAVAGVATPARALLRQSKIYACYSTSAIRNHDEWVCIVCCSDQEGWFLGMILQSTRFCVLTWIYLCPQAELARKELKGKDPYKTLTWHTPEVHLSCPCVALSLHVNLSRVTRKSSVYCPAPFNLNASQYIISGNCSEAGLHKRRRGR